MRRGNHPTDRQKRMRIQDYPTARLGMLTPTDGTTQCWHRLRWYFTYLLVVSYGNITIIWYSIYWLLPSWDGTTMFYSLVMFVCSWPSFAWSRLVGEACCNICALATLGLQTNVSTSIKFASSSTPPFLSYIRSRPENTSLLENGTTWWHSVKLDAVRLIIVELKVMLSGFIKS